MAVPQRDGCMRRRSLRRPSKTGRLERRTRPGSSMPHRIALAVEGPSDAAVLETICRKKGHAARAASAQGKDDLFLKFHKLLRSLDAAFSPTHFFVVADLQPAMECVEEAARWRKAVHERFPKAEFCLCIWELEAWLLA